MGLVTHAIAFGLGYALATPEGRARLTGLRDQGAELARRPEVKQVRERAWDAVGEAGLTARNRLAAPPRQARPAPRRPAPRPRPVPAPATARRPPLRRRSPSCRRPERGAADTSVDDTVVGEVGPENIAGTTVAEDTRAVVLGLPGARPRARAPPAKRK
jgi:hypothetical protein